MYFWGENPKLSTNSPKCSERAFMVQVLSGINVQQIHWEEFCESMWLQTYDPDVWGQSFLDLGKNGRQEGRDDGYGL